MIRKKNNWIVYRSWNLFSKWSQDKDWVSEEYSGIRKARCKMSVPPLVPWQPEAVFNFVHFLEATSHSARSWLWHSSKFIISRMGGFLADIKCQLLGWILIFGGIQYKFLGGNEKMEGALFQRLCTLWIFRYRQMEIQEVFSTGRVDNRKIPLKDIWQGSWLSISPGNSMSSIWCGWLKGWFFWYF